MQLKRVSLASTHGRVDLQTLAETCRCTRKTTTSILSNLEGARLQSDYRLLAFRKREVFVNHFIF